MVQIFTVGGSGRVRAMSQKDFERKYTRDPVVDERLKSVKKDDKVPKVGDTVRLNDEGLEQIFGSRSRSLSHMKTLEMRIVHVDDESMTYPEPTFIVEVDNPEINCFLIDHNCFDIVRRA